MLSRITEILILISWIMSGCILLPATPQNPTFAPGAKDTIASLIHPSPMPRVDLPESDQILFTIPNAVPFSGREGETRPNWLGCGAETFVVAPDGSFWIDDTPAFPNRLLHYSPQGELLQEISLESLVVYPYDLAVTQDSLWVLDVSSQPPKIVQPNIDGTFRATIDFSKISASRGDYRDRTDFG